MHEVLKRSPLARLEAPEKTSYDCTVRGVLDRFNFEPIREQYFLHVFVLKAVDGHKLVWGGGGQPTRFVQRAGTRF